MLTPGSGIPHLSLFGQWTYSKRHGYIYTVRLEWELQKTTLWLLAAWGNKKHHTVLIVARSTSQINKYLMSISQTQKCSYMSNLTNTSGHHTTKEFENWLAFKVTLVLNCEANKIPSDSTRPLYCNGHVQPRAIRVHTQCCLIHNGPHMQQIINTCVSNTYLYNTTGVWCHRGSLLWGR